jgi:pyruvate-ferredoxin/flavodoxin oxidoreductase
MKRAVECGYWHLFRFNPSLAAEGKNPFILDSKEPSGSYREFNMNEARYSSLVSSYPERAQSLFEKAEEHAKARYNELLKLREYFEP